MTRPLDLVLYGATGFTGRHAAARLRDTAPAGLRWAIAARDRAKLDALHEALGLGGDVDVLVADSGDEDAVGRMVQQTRVLLSTAGPYTRFGTPVFDACVAHQTSYADITGETAWVRHMIDRHHARARADGTVLVPLAGYDSVPSDLGAWLLVNHLREEHGEDTQQVYGSFRSRGGFSGGTAATALMLSTLSREDRRLAAHPYTLSPDVEKPREELFAEGDPRRPLRTPEGDWDAPHLMGPVNTRVVRRSASLFAEAGRPYGADFHYQEGMKVKGGGRAAAWLKTAALGAAATALGKKATRPLLVRFLPASGEGPSEEQMEAGRTRARFFATGVRGSRAKLTLDFAGDPAIRFTVLTLVECGLLLATSGARFGVSEPDRGGVLTPAVAFGGALVDSLRARGVQIDLS